MFKNLKFAKEATTKCGYASAEVTWNLSNHLFTDKIPMGNKDRVALPEGKREITGTLSINFDDPLGGLQWGFTSNFLESNDIHIPKLPNYFLDQQWHDFLTEEFNL